MTRQRRQIGKLPKVVDWWGRVDSRSGLVVRGAVSVELPRKLSAGMDWWINLVSLTERLSYYTRI